MPDTRAVITVNGSPLSARDLDRVQSLHIEETLGSPDKISIAMSLTTDNRGGWSSPLDTLVAPAVPFTATLTRGALSYSIEARSVSVSWNLVAGALSTLTVEGMDRSVDLDRREVRRLWQDATDSAIAQTLFTEHGLAARVATTPAGTDSDTYSPQQSDTDWSFLKHLAGRNGFDVRVESINDIATGVFAKVDPLAPPQASLDLGYGPLGGTATASAQLLAGQEVHLTRTIPGTTDTDRATDPGTGQAMGRRSLGGATLIRTNAAANIAVTDAQTAATAMAERSAFAATLSATLTAPEAPLIRARRTVTIRGLGDTLNGLWLVTSVTHSITPAGHTQALSLTRNALGDLAADGAPSTAAAAAALTVNVSVSL